MARDSEADDRRYDAGGTTPDGQLLPFAKALGRELRMRSELDPLLDDARWMILLDIYLAMGEAREIPFMSAAHASRVAVSTAQRYIHEMIDAGLIEQHRSGADQRITHVSLTGAGIGLVQKMLSDAAALRARR
ncbi:MAG: MarR family winged helix-turn-helix transcriptional regulator [Candidatus Andeanibacterium colombiense]|uniref:MarR family winged helix-turn-helix transcriptional regulator n=1 Tax=Candidatus Andeanibacterium colombiense TaxID=3121345 RepID=A0AAJ6BMP7_9SPHN|nr:MAG: MarR family winged helix-turn-helix transcriptional regulator [Sphingomonadaceae bacterium]